jgi:membrane fusion protein (multidrug efflux system)
MSDEAPAAPVAGRRRRLWRAFGRLLLLVLGPAALAAAGGYYYVASGRYVGTENAYVKADKIAISADVSGRVIFVAVDENQFVEDGQLLFQIDDERFRIALAHREAQVDKARQEIEELRALYRQKQAELAMAVGDVEYYREEFRRTKDLRDKGHVAQAKLDKVRRDVVTTQQHVEAVKQDIAGVLASLGGDPEIPVDRHPRVTEAGAERDRVEVDLNRTWVLAPRSGIVTNVGLQIGEYVAAGTPIFSLVDAKAQWIEANLKETDLTHVREGQQASVRVDAYPDHFWRAKVTSISPATGAEFAILPPQNASGNWVKVVQRIPVRLELSGPGDGPPLRAGMSVKVEIDTKHERTLPAVAASALAWVRGDRRRTGGVQQSVSLPVPPSPR